MVELLLVGYPVAGALIALLYLFCLHKGWLRVVRLAALALVIWGFFVAFFTVYNIGGGFGLGTLLFCVSIPSALLAFIAFVAERRRILSVAQGDRARRRLYVIGLVLVPLSMFAPFIGQQVVTRTCFTLNSALAVPVIDALQAYRRDRGAFPRDIEALIPDYLPALPAPTCFQPYSWLGSGVFQTPAYRLETCRTGETLITLPDVTFASVQRYNLTTGRWSSISFLDGACNFLR